MTQTELERLVVRFTLDNKEYLSELSNTVQKTKAELEKMKQAMEGMEKTSKIMATVQQGAVRLMALFGVGLGLNQLKSTVENVYQTFVRFESGQRGLRAILEANRQNVTSSMTDYNAYATQVSKTTTNSSLATVQLLKLAEGYRLSGDSAKAAARDAQALAEFTGHSPEQLMRITSAMQKGHYDEAQAMSRMLPELRHIKDEVLLINSYNALVTAGMNAQAEHAETVAGRWEKIKNRVEETEATLGGKMNPTLEVTMDYLERAGGIAKDNGDNSIGSKIGRLTQWSNDIAMKSLTPAMMLLDKSGLMRRVTEHSTRGPEQGVEEMRRSVKSGIGQLIIDIQAELNKGGLNEIERRLQTFARLGGDVSGGMAQLRQKEKMDRLTQLREMMDLQNTLSPQDRISDLINPQGMNNASFDPEKAKSGFLAEIIAQTQKLSNQYQGIVLVNEQFEKMVRIQGASVQNSSQVKGQRDFIANQMAQQAAFKVKMDIMTPQEKLDYELEKLYDLVRKGTLTWHEYSIAANKARNEILGVTAAITAANAGGSNAARVAAFESMQKVSGVFSPYHPGGPPPLPPGVTGPPVQAGRFADWIASSQRGPMPHQMAQPGAAIAAAIGAGMGRGWQINAGGPPPQGHPGWQVDAGGAPGSPQSTAVERAVVRGLAVMGVGKMPENAQQMNEAAGNLKTAGNAILDAAKLFNGLKPANLK